VSLSMKRLIRADVLTGRTTSASLGATFPTPEDVDWSPKDNLLVVGAVSSQGLHGLWTVTLAGNRRHCVFETGYPIKSPRWSHQGDAIYFLRTHGSTMDLCKLPVPSKGDKPRVLLSGIETSMSSSPAESRSSISFSRDESKMLYARETVQSNLWLFEHRAGDLRHRPRVTQLTSGTGFDTGPHISPEDGRVAFAKGDRAPANIFTIPMAGGDEEQLTFLSSQSAFPTWSPSGDEIAFLSDEGGPWRIWKVSTRGGPAQQFERSRPMDAPNIPAWAPGDYIVYDGPDRKTLALLDPRSGVERAVARDDSAQLLAPQWAPDHEHLAYLRFRDFGHGSILVRSVLGGASESICDSILIPVGWSRDGRWVYAWDHLDLSERIMAIPTRGGAPRLLMDIPGGRSMGNPVVTGDGQKAVAPVLVRQRDAWLVENFQQPPR